MIPVKKNTMLNNRIEYVAENSYKNIESNKYNILVVIKRHPTKIIIK
jgi:hypothetical protein